MLLRDMTLYRTLLQRLTLAELLALYERTAPDYGLLARTIAEELDARLGERSENRR